jgi:hypothetical protein
LSTTRTIVAATLAGLVAGLAVLGVGGRIVMRLLTVTLEEPAKFTVLGSLEVIGAGAAWGALTGPILLALDGFRVHVGRGVALLFGIIVLALAFVSLGVVLAFDGIVAPKAFIVLAAVLFLALFLVHGVAVELMLTRWRKQSR